MHSVLKKGVFFLKTISVVLSFAALAQVVSADARNTSELLKKHKLYDALSTTEGLATADGLKLRADIFYELGMMEKALYSLASADMKIYTPDIRNMKIMTGGRGRQFRDRIRKLNSAGRYEEASKAVAELNLALKKIHQAGAESINRNVLKEGLDYYDPELYAAISKTYLNLSILTYKRAIEAAGHTERAGLLHRLIGECYFGLGDYAEAVKYYGKVNIADMETVDTASAHAYFSFLKTGDSVRAEQFMKRFANFEVFRSEVGHYFFLSGETSRGKVYIKEAYEQKLRELEKKYGKISFTRIQEKDHPIFRNHALMDKSTGRYVEAKTAMELIKNYGKDSLSLNPPVLFIELAGIILHQGSFGDVLRYLTELHSDYPEIGPLLDMMDVITMKKTGV